MLAGQLALTVADPIAPSLGQLLPILAAKLQRGMARISAAISRPRVPSARVMAAIIGS